MGASAGRRRDHPRHEAPKYLEENVAAADVELDSHDLAALDEVAPLGVAAGERYNAAAMTQVHR